MQKGARKRSNLEAEVRIQKVVKGVVSCFFFGKTAEVVGLSYKKGMEHPNAPSYPLEAFESPRLDDELEYIEDVLGVERDGNKIFKLPVGYVHVYNPKEAINCSAMTLSKALTFFTFDGETARIELPKESIDVKPFMYPDVDLKVMGIEKEYAWKTAVVPWDWNEEVWTERLFQCLDQQLTGITVLPAFKWKPSTYRSEICTLFQNVMDLQVTPFKGMTDILLLGKKTVAMLRVVELGIDRAATCTVTVAGQVKKWPEKIGELLASMYMFATLNYLNNLCQTPDKLGWTTYGMFAIRHIGFIILKMTLDQTGCVVTLFREGTMLDLGEAVAYLATCIKE